MQKARVSDYEDYCSDWEYVCHNYKIQQMGSQSKLMSEMGSISAVMDQAVVDALK
jgi:hypothetical protein